MKTIENITREFMTTSNSRLFDSQAILDVSNFMDPAKAETSGLNNSIIDAFTRAARHELLGRMNPEDLLLSLSSPLPGRLLVHPETVSALIIVAFWHGVKAAQETKDEESFEIMMKKMMEGE